MSGSSAAVWLVEVGVHEVLAVCSSHGARSRCVHVAVHVNDHVQDHVHVNDHVNEHVNDHVDDAHARGPSRSLT